jgi:8-oxo-dGTP pyrophosphatase MutT (NUDIX family)
MSGKILYYILWPIIWFYAPLTRRARGIAIHDGKVLLVINRFGAGDWQFPGGGINRGESVVDATSRELKEELNLDLKSTKELHEEPKICKKNGLLMRYHYVSIKLKNPDAKLELDHELTDAKWFIINDLKKVSSEVAQGLDLALKQG